MKKHDKALAAMRVDKKRKISLGKFDPGSTAGIEDKQEGRDFLDDLTAELTDLQYKLYAEAKTGLLVVFQALDTGGKDGVIRKVFGPLNPQGVMVTSFKRPTDIELSHDYLWRIHHFIPAKGMIRIFNRSHYEDVLVHRVHKLIPKDELEKRYRQLNDFERYLHENNTVILKFFLHISKDEQKQRLEARLENPKKRWKFELGDLKERAYWDRYQDAYEAVLEKCSAAHAPWYVIPSDNKWYRDWAVAEVIARRLRALDPKVPKEQPGLNDVKVE